MAAWSPGPGPRCKHHDLQSVEVMKVIMGVFLQITFYVASNDDVIMMSQKERFESWKGKRILDAGRCFIENMRFTRIKVVHYRLSEVCL